MNISAHYINMDKRSDRMKKVEDEFKREKLMVERFRAIDGKKITKNTPEIALFKGNNFEYRRGVMGAALSHIGLWRKLVKSTDDYFIIFEDDIEIKENFNACLHVLTEQLEHNKYDIIFLGYHVDVFHENHNEIIMGENYKNFMKITAVTEDIKKFIWGGLFSYVIHRDFAKILLDDIDKNCLVEPIDTYVLKYKNLHIFVPLLVVSPVMTFYNGTDSDIQYDIIGIYDEYVFFQYKDSPGNDITWSNVTTFEKLKEQADSLPNCVAFNTYAWIKSDIIHPDNFIDMPGMNSRAHGIYVKKSKLDELGYCYDEL